MPLSAIQHRVNTGRYYNQTHGNVSDKKMRRKLSRMAASPGDPVAAARAHLLLHALALVANASISCLLPSPSSHPGAVFPLPGRPVTSGGAAAGLPAFKICEMRDQAQRRHLQNMLGGRGPVPDNSKHRGIVPYVYFSPAMTTARRGKRIAIDRSSGMRAREYREFIENHCHIRTKTLQGKVLGDSLLIAGEYVRNPMRGIVEKLKALIQGEGELSRTQATLLEIANLGQDIILGFFTMGAYPVIKYTSSKSLDVAGHAINGDSACVWNDFSPEELANLLFNTEVGITDRRAFFNSLVHPKPRELAGTHVFEPDGAFVHERLPAGINTVKHLAVDREGSTLTVREAKTGEYVITPAQQGKPGKTDRKVYFDVINDKINIEGNIPPRQGFDYKIQDGKKFLRLYNENYELTFNSVKKTPELKLHNRDGTESRVPVYREKISHSWHLGTHNHKPVFKEKQEKIINSLKIDFNNDHYYISVDNLHQPYYGLGKIIEVRPKDAAYGNHVPLMKVIELKGELVPVREVVVPERGIKYEIYNRSMPRRRGHPVEFDGRRWLFEQATSVHAGKTLRRAISKKLTADGISAHHLSAPDEKGLRWDANNNAHLKIKNKFIKIKKYSDSYNKYFLINNDRKIMLRFRKNKFHVETYKERIYDLRQVGMSGHGGVRKRKAAIDILKEVDGFSFEQAKMLLAQYRFPTNGLFNERSFALDIEHYGTIPPWAKRFKISPRNEPSGSTQDMSVRVFDPDDESIVHEFSFGETVGEGDFGLVLKDAKDPDFYIKKMHARSDEDSDIDIEALAKKEAETFRQFYGPDSAKVFKDDKGNVYNRMYKIPGRTLESVPEGSLPRDAIERYVDMLEKMNVENIIHADLHTGNIMWDGESNMFFPIDITNIKPSYFRSGSYYKHMQNRLGEDDWNSVIDEIEHKMVALRPDVT
ncbi:OspG family effector kinase [Acerihabitans arboris]|uniref:Kinase OspG kinase domain-containing protein n=1 Tax=Acerihabitans arboris TaxID=2691583 RepID=A0A845SIV7_9GAMM|nr:hypothetical protein [Acerihabitans arboris]NDL64850.1 hypothetical protein [Acerihabitans arboris]